MAPNKQATNVQDIVEKGNLQFAVDGEWLLIRAHVGKEVIDSMGKTPKGYARVASSWGNKPIRVAGAPAGLVGGINLYIKPE